MVQDVKIPGQIFIMLQHRGFIRPSTVLSWNWQKMSTINTEDASMAWHRIRALLERDISGSTVANAGAANVKCRLRSQRLSRDMETC